MPRRSTILVISLAVLLLAGAVLPGTAVAVSFVDRQVQASGLLLQNAIDRYGQARQFVYPPVKMVRKGGGLTTPIWPANPWTGKVMAPGKSRGTYTYTLGAGGTSYKLVLHLSSGNYKLTGGMPRWFKSERDTAATQNLLLLQRYVEAYAATHAGSYPAAAEMTREAFGAGYVWPRNPWTREPMAAGTAVGDYAYTSDDDGYTLKVRLTTGWSSPPLSPIGVTRILATSR